VAVEDVEEFVTYSLPIDLYIIGVAEWGLENTINIGENYSRFEKV